MQDLLLRQKILTFSCGRWALVPWPGIEPGHCALGEYRVLVTGPPGKSQSFFLWSFPYSYTQLFAPACVTSYILKFPIWPWFLPNCVLERGLPKWLSGQESVHQCRRLKRHGFNPWVRKIPWRGKWQLTPVFLPGKFHGERSLAGYHPQGHRESHMTEHTEALQL